MSPYSYLRLSVTDRCNFDCFYCRPRLRRNFIGKKDALTFAEMLSLARCLTQQGILHIRLTGGEPLLKKDLKYFIQDLSALPGLRCLSLTTNGYFLAAAVSGLKAAGIKKINVSLDTLKKDRFKKLAGLDALPKILRGVFKATGSGFESVKLNVVLLRGFNDDEILDFVDFGLKEKVDVRFIEYFPTKSCADGFSSDFISSHEVKKIIEEKYGDLEFLGPDAMSGPAQYFRIQGKAGRIGFISSVTGFFCPDCNRLRLTCDGRLYPCLHSGHSADLRRPLRAGDEKGLSSAIQEIFSDKRLYNRLHCSRSFEMSSIGG
jgi:cyclic pyranopterin phosphate synthase